MTGNPSTFKDEGVCIDEGVSIDEGVCTSIDEGVCIDEGVSIDEGVCIAEGVCTSFDEGVCIDEGVSIDEGVRTLMFNSPNRSIMHTLASCVAPRRVRIPSSLEMSMVWLNVKAYAWSLI